MNISIIKVSLANIDFANNKSYEDLQCEIKYYEYKCCEQLVCTCKQCEFVYREFNMV